MANLTRRSTKRNLAGEHSHKSMLQAAFGSEWMVEKYKMALAMAEEKGDVKEIRSILRDLGDRMYGRPAVVVSHEQVGVEDVLEAFHNALIGAGMGDVIVLENPDVGESFGEGTGSKQLAVPADLLDGGQLQSDAGAEEVSRLEGVDSAGSGGSQGWQVVLDSEGMRQVHSD